MNAIISPPRRRPPAVDAQRVMDVGVSLLLLTVLGPVMAIVAIVVRCGGPGPILFLQVRVGRGGRPFRVYKFRSMHTQQVGPSITSGHDTRVTRVGRVLRAWKLDELPQLFNVLRGDMALVGPRPEVPEYVRHYGECGHEVLAVRPGITGANQLLFRREEQLLTGRSDVEAAYVQDVLPAKLATDLQYVRHRTLRGDIVILARTVWCLFGQRGG
jgi:lipopolysaccharide/colanic/teichoic acid biosynthesis glycosyltransferase